MHTPTIVAQVMQCCLPLMHAARWRALHDVVVSSVNGHALSLVALAVGTPRTISVRHRVKHIARGRHICVDRLLAVCRTYRPILLRSAIIPPSPPSNAIA